MLASQDESEIAKEMPLQRKDVARSEINCDLKLVWTGVEYNKWRILKRRICLVLKRSVDKGNLFVLEVELIPFLCQVICLFGNIANQNRFQFLNLMESS